MRYLSLLLLLCVSCCCDKPNVRTMPGIEQCPDACKNLERLKCEGYIEVINMPLEDGGTQAMDCTDFCKYQMSNSTPINTTCLSKIKDCSEIQSVCKE